MKNYKTKCRLNNIKSCNQLLARTVNSVIDETISEEEARTIGYLINILIRGLEKSDLEQRMEIIEDLLEKRDKAS